MFSKQRSPKTATQITPRWLEHELRRNGHLPQGHVQSAERERWKSTDVAEVHRVEVSYREAHLAAPRNLVVKLPLPTAPTWVRRLARREIMFYRKFAPATAGLSVPTFYAGACAPKQVRYHLILEDLSATHSTSASHSPTDAECAGIVDGLATVHAVWWSEPRPRIEKGVHSSIQSVARASKRTEEHVRGLLAALDDRLSVVQREACETVIAAYPQVLGRVRPIMVVGARAVGLRR